MAAHEALFSVLSQRKAEYEWRFCQPIQKLSTNQRYRGKRFAISPANAFFKTPEFQKFKGPAEAEP
jgi:hypothetical protein